MEIERTMSGDLNRNIEQCVNALLEVERRVHNLKVELSESLQQLQIQGRATQAGIQGFNPQAGVQLAAPAAAPTAPIVVPATVLTPFQPFVGPATLVATPQSILGAANSGFYTPFTPFQGRLPVQGIQAFSPVAGVPNFGYIW